VNLRAPIAQRPAVTPAGARVAVVDIGSNSIRLVVFDRLTRAPVPLFNEKILCGLGRGLEKTGQLNEAGVELALANLSRFVTIAEAMEVGRLDLLATAAVRDAANGGEFVAEVERSCNVPVRVLSGEEEARLSALGVLAGIPEADGLMGDLGGGSLELVELAKGKLGRHATLPLGPLRLMAAGDRDDARRVVERHLDSLDWLGELKVRTFYPVGGAWRTLARIHMEQTHYPLHVIQQYQMGRRQTEDLARVLSRLGKHSLANLPRRRAESLPSASIVLERLLKVCRPERIVFSAYGLREGHLYNELPAGEQKRDPLLAACHDIAVAEQRFAVLGPLLDGWLDPLFPLDGPAERRLRQAICLLSDLAWREHPDYRAKQAFTRMLHLPIGGIEHVERVIAAMALAARYGGDLSGLDVQSVDSMLDDAQRQRAMITGLALRLAYSVSGATAELLSRTALRRDDGRVTLLLPPGERAMHGEAVQRRLDALGRALGLATEVSDFDIRRRTG
jgi:exopolyphosphatase/guanosine-5'-triphosphate,3'-diphosphate pyrophosphatase